MAAAAETPTLETAIGSLVSVAFPTADLSSEERDTLTQLFVGCRVDLSPFMAMLDDAANATSVCADFGRVSVWNLMTDERERAHLRACVDKWGQFLIRHGGGMSLLAIPELLDVDKDVVTRCANGEPNYEDAYAVVLQRFAACVLPIGDEHRAIFAKVHATNGTVTEAVRLTRASLRSICNFLYEWESMHLLVDTVGPNVVQTLVDILR